MLETTKELLLSQELLNYSKAIAILALAGFSCWAIFYLGKLLKEGYGVIKEIKDSIEQIDELIRAFREKLERSTSYLLLISKGMEKIVDLVSGYSGKKKKEKK